MTVTYSAEEPAKVLVEHTGQATEMWLRKNIEQDTGDMGPEGEPVTYWKADEAHALFPTFVTAEDVEANFDAWWNSCEDAAKTVPERVSDNADAISASEAAILELADIVLGGE